MHRSGVMIRDGLHFVIPCLTGIFELLIFLNISDGRPQASWTTNDMLG